METSTDCTALFAALAKAQATIKVAGKDSTNPHYKSQYADLESIDAACRAALSANGLCVMQGLGYENGQVRVTTRLGHASGQWVQATLSVPVTKQDAQGVGSAATYARRYSLAALIGVVAGGDDDGNDAVGPQPYKAPNSGRLMDQPEIRDQVAESQQRSRTQVAAREAAKTGKPAAPETSMMRAPGKLGQDKNGIAGLTIADMEDEQLSWWVETLSENIANPAKARWVAENQSMRDALQAEQAYRRAIRPGVPNGADQDDIPF